MKRGILVVLLVSAACAVLYGYVMTRQERVYRQLVVQGEGALARGDTAAAVVAFSNAIRSKPEAMLGYLKRGDAHRRGGDLKLAALDLDRATTLDPAAPRAFELRGDVEGLRGRHDRAAVQYAASVKLDDRPSVLYKLGLSHHLSGNTADAYEALAKAVAADSRLAEAHYLLGVCLRELDRNEEAEEALTRAISLSPGLSAAREQLSELYAASGRRMARIAELERLLALDGGPARQVSLAVAYATAGQTPKAIRLLRSTTEVYPGYAGAYLALGRIWRDAAEGDGGRDAWSRSVAAYEKAVALEPSGTALSELARVRLSVLGPAAAERDLQRAVAALPADASVFLLIAEGAGRAGDAQAERRALVEYQALTGEHPRQTQMDQRIGDLSIRLGEPHVAAGWYTRAAGTSRTPAPLLVKAAEAALLAGDHASARSAVQAALARDPGLAAARALQRRLEATLSQ
ncbi:MAG: tetratricopeptide repeat protein [Acidobacteria bacterium]|nr:tetratricopeptide repeat protein [Acidobacteriota bacterium]